MLRGLAGKLFNFWSADFCFRCATESLRHNLGMQEAVEEDDGADAEELREPSGEEDEPEDIVTVMGKCAEYGVRMGGFGCRERKMAEEILSKTKSQGDNRFIKDDETGRNRSSIANFARITGWPQGPHEPYPTIFPCSQPTALLPGVKIQLCDSFDQADQADHCVEQLTLGSPSSSAW